MIERTIIRGLAVSAMLAASSAAHATFHFMHIEQVIGGVNGDTSRQAVQLQMRSAFQNLVSQSRIVAYDAAGGNPVIIVDMTTDVSGFSPGARVLIASASFATSPSVTPDFTMTNLIPVSYLAAGSLTFEDDFGTVLSRVCWGGAGYTGSTAVAEFTNDDDGDVAPPVSGALPSTTLSALKYNGSFSSITTTNSANFSVPAGAATFTNNAGSSGTVVPPAPSCPGDIEDDNAVNINDLLAVINAWGPCVNCPATACPPDVDPQPSGNCTVNINDLLAVINSWGPCPG